MNSSMVPESEASVAGVLCRLVNKGMRLWIANGQLAYRASKGALDQNDIATLRARKGQIIEFLRGTGSGVRSSEVATSPIDPGIHLAPLTFSQIAHWQRLELNQRPSHCVIGFVTRWRGRLNVVALQRAVSELIQRHDALRTRIAVCDGTPMQEIRESLECELPVDDLTELAESAREAEAARLIHKHMLDPIDVTVIPLFRFRLIRLQEDDHMLTAAMEHIIADGFSLDVLRREVVSAYKDAAQGRPPSLPSVVMQFSDYAVWQRGASPSWIESHGSYWNEHMKGCRRMRFPSDGSADKRVGFGCLPFRIRNDLGASMREWCRRRGTTVVMSFFLAYVALVFRWCNVSEAVILFQIDGRTSDKTDRTVGYLASLLYLRMVLLESDSFLDLLRRLRAEYCNAYEHADSSYMEAQQPPPDFTRNSRFNWLQQRPADASIKLEEDIDVSSFHFEPKEDANLEIDTEPTLGFLETDEEIVGYVQFPLGRFSAATMERFAHNFLRFLEVLLRCPDQKVTDVLIE